MDLTSVNKDNSERNQWVKSLENVADLNKLYHLEHTIDKYYFSFVN